MPDEIRIGAQGLPEDESRKLPYFLKWVNQGRTAEFRIADRNEPIDVLLVDIDGAAATGEQASKGGSQNIPVISVSTDPGRLPGGRPGLVYPLRVAELERALEEAESSRSRGARPALQPGRPVTPSNQPGSNPEPGPDSRKVADLVQPLLAQRSGQDLHLAVREEAWLTASPRSGYFATPLEVRDFAKHCPELIQADWTPTDQALPEEPSQWKPVRQLVWLLAYYGARDGLLPQVPRGGGFSLEAWPDYQVIPMEANNLKVWAYLKWHAADARTIAAETGVDWGQVLGSINAGWLCGQVRAAEAVGEPGEAHREGLHSGLLGKIRDRLGLRSVNA